MSSQLNNIGSENSSYGFASLFKNTSGSYNTAIGSGAMDSCSTGSQNTGIGKSVMYFTTTGNNNTAAGYLALSNNVTGSNNTGMGYSAIINTAGDNNTGLGYQAGIANNSGTNNTFVGYNSNSSLANLTNATAIGNNAIVGSSNSLILGGTGANAVNVGVGTTTPGASNLLDLVSTTKGFVMPRMTGVQMAAIASPVAGMQVYNTDSACTCMYNGTTWKSLCGRVANEWLDKDSLSGYTGAAMIYAKQALNNFQDTLAIFDDGSWYHADPGINQFTYGNSARNNNLFNSTKIPAASGIGGYNFNVYNNQIDNTSNAAGNVGGISSNTFLPTTTGRTGLTYGANIQAIINGSAVHTGPIYGANISAGVYGSANYGSIFGLQGFFADGLTGANTVGTAYAANLQFYKGGTGGNYTLAYGANNNGWIASGAGGTIGTLSGSRNSVNYPNGGVNNVVITTANGGEYYVGLGTATGTGSIGTANGIYVALNLAATVGNVIPVTTVNGINIDFQSALADPRITNAYGIKMNDVTRGNVINYGIYTGLGKISFGDNTEIRGTGYLTLPNGTTAQRPGTPVSGMTRYNSTLGVYEGYLSPNWVQLANMNAVATAATIGAIAVPMTAITTYTITPTGACTFNASGGTAGQYCTFYITAAGPASFVLTWGTNFKTTGTLSTGITAGKVFTITFICKDGTTWAETSRTTAM